MNWPTLRCVALTVRGKRCNRQACTAHPITFEWDPVRGRGISGPFAPLCRLHDYVWELEPGERVEIVGGWLGRAWNPDAACWTVCTTVYESRGSLFGSQHWWALRRPTGFGQCDDTAYDDAMAGGVR